MAHRRSNGLPKHGGANQLTVELPPLPDGLIEREYDAGDVKLNYAIGENNGPPIILIHGLGGMMHEFFSVCELLKDRWQVILVDLRGHGKSSHTPNGYNFDSYHSDIIKLMRDIVGGPSVVWGHSLGAIVTMNIAAEAPELVSAAILEDPPMMIAGDPSHSPFLAMFQTMQDLMLSKASDDEVRATLRQLTPNWQDRYLTRYLIRIRLNDPEIYTGPLSGRHRESWDAERTLRGVMAPTLLMQADPAVGAAVLDEHATRAMKLLPNARHLKYEGANHMIHAALPEQTVKDVEAFVAKMA